MNIHQLRYVTINRLNVMNIHVLTFDFRVAQMSQAKRCQGNTTKNTETNTRRR